MSQGYNYGLAAFTGLIAGHAEPSTGRLRRELINDAGLPDTKALMSLIWIGGVTQTASVVFAEALTAPEVLVLDALVAAHSGEPLSSVSTPVRITGVETPTGRLPSESYKGSLPSDPVASHNFCKPSTWWPFAAQKTGVALEDVSLLQDPVEAVGTVWAPVAGYYDGTLDPPERPEWINLRWGGVSMEDQIMNVSQYYPLVEQDTGGGYAPLSEESKDEAHETGLPSNDYRVDYEEALVRLAVAAPGAAMRASFWVPTKSDWVLSAPEGYLLEIDEVEVNLSDDAGIRDDILFLTTVAGQPAGATPERVYKTLSDFIDESNRYYCIKARDVGHWRGLPRDIDVHAWDYKGLKPLSSQAFAVSPGVWYGTVLTVRTRNHKPAVGYRATMTVYLIKTALGG